MYTRSIITALLVTGGLAAAAPSDPDAGAPQPGAHDRTKPSRDRNDVHVTVTAGRGRLGFAALQISPALRDHLGAPSDRGVLVDDVRVDSPAARAGLQVGDVITEVDGAAIDSASDVLKELRDRRSGDVVPIVVSRNGRDVTLQAKLDSEPGPHGLDARGWQRFGLDDMPFEMPAMFEGRGSGGKLQEMRRRLDELERRIRELEPKS